MTVARDPTNQPTDRSDREGTHARSLASQSCLYPHSPLRAGRISATQSRTISDASGSCALGARRERLGHRAWPFTVVGTLPLFVTATLELLLSSMAMLATS